MDQCNDAQRSLFITRQWQIYLRSVLKHSGANWTIQQLVILTHIAVRSIEGLDCTVNEIAEAEGIPQQNVSQCVRVLLERGYLVREPDPRDGRRFLLRPAEKMLENRRKAQAEIVASLRELPGDAWKPPS